MTVKKGDFIAIDFTGTCDGQVFDTTNEKVAKENGLQSKNQKFEPLVVIVGEGHVIPGLDKELIGKVVGKDYEFKFGPEDAFGKKDAKLLKLVPMKLFKKENLNPFPGLQINADGKVGTVRTVSGGRVYVDFNHQLASKDVEYKVTITKVVEDKAEKVKTFATMLRIPTEDVKVEGDKATITLPAALPEQYTAPLSEDFSRVTGVKTVEFAAKEPKAAPKADAKQNGADKPGAAETKESAKK
jgi:FKBP-type peptidyl-prolyl cis-trans isomerase 2